MGSLAMFRQLIARALIFGFLALYGPYTPDAFAQIELAGSWAGRGNELSTGTGLPCPWTSPAFPSTKKDACAR